MLEISTSTQSIIPSGGHDAAIWMTSSSGKFHLAPPWKFIKPHIPKVPWYHTVWFKNMVPKHGFIYWLAVLDRLSTRSRLHKFSSHISPTYVFCDAFETRDDLFFSCP